LSARATVGRVFAMASTLALAVLVLGFPAVPASSAAGPSSIELLDAELNHIDVVPITVPSSETSSSAMALIHNKGSRAVNVTRVFGIATDAQVTVEAIGADGSGAFRLAPNDLRGIRVTADATKAVDTTGGIYAIVESTATKIATLTIKKAALHTVVVVGATDGGLSLANVGTSFRRQLVLTSPDVDTFTISVEVRPLTGPDSDEARLGIASDGSTYAEGTPIEISRTQPVALVMSGTLSRIGPYEGLVVVNLPNDAQMVVPLTITTTGDPLSIDFDDAADLRGEAGNAPRSIVITGHEDAGRQLVFRPPMIRASRTETDQSTSHTFEEVQVGLDKTESSYPVTPWGPVRVAGEITGLTEAGEYAVIATFAEPSGAPVIVTFNVLIREPWLAAATWIAVGILVGALLRVLLGAGAAWLAATHRLQLLESRVAREGAVAADEEQPLFAAVGAQIRTLRNWRNASRLARMDSVAQGAVERKVDILVRWSHVKANARKLEIIGGHAVALAATEAYLGDPDRISPEDAATEATRLGQIESTLRTQQEVLTQIGQMRASVAQRRALNRDPERQRLTEIEERLTQSRVAVDQADVAAAISALNLARQAWLTLLLDGLAADVARRPDMIPPGSWDPLKTDIEGRIAGARAAPTAQAGLAQYESIARDLVIAMATALRDQAVSEANQLRPQPAAAPRVAALDRVAAACGVILTAASTTPYDELHAKYVETVNDYESAPQLPGTPPSPFDLSFGTAGAAAVPTAVAPTPAGLASLIELPVAAIAVVANSPVFSGCALLLISALAYLLVVAIGVLIGVQLMWSGNFAWGGFDDRVIAFLWGLGVHAVGGNTFSGVSGLASKLATPAAA